MIETNETNETNETFHYNGIIGSNLAKVNVKNLVNFNFKAKDGKAFNGKVGNKTRIIMTKINGKNIRSNGSNGNSNGGGKYFGVMRVKTFDLNLMNLNLNQSGAFDETQSPDEMSEVSKISETYMASMASLASMAFTFCTDFMVNTYTYRI